MSGKASSETGYFRRMRSTRPNTALKNELVKLGIPPSQASNAINTLRKEWGKQDIAACALLARPAASRRVSASATTWKAGRLDHRLIVVLRLVDPGRNRPSGRPGTIALGRAGQAHR